MAERAHSANYRHRARRVHARRASPAAEDSCQHHHPEAWREQAGTMQEQARAQHGSLTCPITARPTSPMSDTAVAPAGGAAVAGAAAMARRRSGALLCLLVLVLCCLLLLNNPACLPPALRVCCMMVMTHRGSSSCLKDRQCRFLVWVGKTRDTWKVRAQEREGAEGRGGARELAHTAIHCPLPTDRRSTQARTCPRAVRGRTLAAKAAACCSTRPTEGWPALRT